MTTARISRAVRFIACALVFALILAANAPGGAALVRPLEQLREPSAPSAPEEPGDHTFPNCRLGMTAWEDQMDQFDIVSTLNAGLYVDFWMDVPAPGPAEAEYVRMITLSQDRGASSECGPDYGYSVLPLLEDHQMGWFVDNSPGSLWIVGNEVDRIGQHALCPQQYAEAYHDVYYFIKGRDPAAQVAVAGLVEVTPGRMQYLDIVWDSYLAKYGEPMPVDVWTMHIYILSETGLWDAHVALGTDRSLRIPYSDICDDENSYCQAEHDDIGLFEDQVRLMRQWMKQHGQQQKPLLLTEFGLLKPYHYDDGICPANTTTCPPEGVPGCFCDENGETFHPARVATFLQLVLDYLLHASDPDLGHPFDEYRLVQQSLWYSLSTVAPTDVGHASNLVDPAAGYARTVPGESWEGLAKAIAPAPNLLVTDVPGATGRAWLPGGPGTAKLSAVVMNNGNIAPDQTVVVTFYSDQNLRNPIGSTTLSGLAGCARRAVVVEALATSPTWGVGLHQFWVKVDSANSLDEVHETDNVGTGTVEIGLVRSTLPLVFRGFTP